MTLAQFLAMAAQFQRPDSLAKLLEQYRANVTQELFFSDPKHKPALEAWQAAMFALGYEGLRDAPVEVRISHPAPFPDFQLKVDEQVFDVESTMSTSVKFGERYRGKKELGPPKVEKADSIPPFDPAVISEAVAKKAKKHYGAGVHLLVYVNRNGHRANDKEVAVAVEEGGGGKFESVWIITGQYLGCPRPSEKLMRCDGWHKVKIEDPTE